jgi:hypothetical protein
MRRIALLAFLQCFGMMAVCQSTGITSAGAQASPQNPSSPQTLFKFSGGQFGRFSQSVSRSGESTSTGSCNGLNANQAPASEQAGASQQLFHAPCVNLRTLMEMADVNQPAAPLVVRRGPQVKAEPIPTQWPDAKFEQIPTTWPRMKMQQIAGRNSGSAPSK